MRYYGAEFIPIVCAETELHTIAITKEKSVFLGYDVHKTQGTPCHSILEEEMSPCVSNLKD